jgi:2'-5' RNA ligase
MTPETDAQRPWRCFVAVPMPAALRASLATAVEDLRADPAAEAEWRFADPSGWHLTVAFLGATPPASVDPLVDRVETAVSDLEPFVITTGGLGSFPAGRHARVLWYGVQDTAGRLRELARRVQAAAGIDAGVPFTPHITLARARDRRGAAVHGLVSGDAPSGEVPVRGVTLFRSHLSSGPARYLVLAEMPFGPPLRAGALQ